MVRALDIRPPRSQHDPWHSGDETPWGLGTAGRSYMSVPLMDLCKGSPAEPGEEGSEEDKKKKKGKKRRKKKKKKATQGIASTASRLKLLIVASRTAAAWTWGSARQNAYGELEKLNQSTDDINRRETELEAQLEAQRATQDFQRATEVLRAAKETISLAEQRLLEDDKRQFDSAWQEMLNHATQRVMEAEQTKTRSELVHKETAAKYNAAMGRMKQLEKKLKRAINKSKPYFELKAKYYVQLEQLKKTVDDLQAKLALAKGEYKTALKNLEMISDEIHERRRSTAMGPRGCGVGAEGSNTSVEDLSASKLESDTISMASEVFEDDNGSSFVSEEDSETQSVSSLSSGPTSPCEVPAQFPPATRPGSLDLPSPVSLSEFGIVFPVLGPRSECSGASSPECEAERGDRAEGAENKTSDRVNKNRSSNRSSSTEGLALDNRMKQLSLQCMKIKEGICAGRKAAQIG
ncbi:SH3 domain-binding protein 5 isoform X2 [Dromaius novaehollandiae]|uniref:SH3 domain-binding protein 5 isoform X2 n=1 Tax=Dromaius novaehollandiae TaxID=8790 RepID=UPI00311F77B0